MKFLLQTGKQSTNCEKLSRSSFYYEQQNITQKTRVLSGTKNLEKTDANLEMSSGKSLARLAIEKELLMKLTNKMQLHSLILYS